MKGLKFSLFSYAAALTVSISCAGNTFAANAVPDEVVIFRGKLSAKDHDAALSGLGAMTASSHSTKIQRIRLHSSGSSQISTLSSGDLRELEAACEKLVSSGAAIACSPNYERHKLASTRSADTQYDELWGLERIETPAAWEITEGSRSVIVGVIDTGIDITHPDFDQNIWTNIDEIDGDGIDNDGNGYVDDIYGYNFNDGDPLPMDGDGHGTHVAGTIGARKDNNLDIAGISPAVSMMALKVLGDDGSGTVAAVAEGLVYAADNGAHVVNMSLGSSDSSSVELAAVRHAQIAGVLVMAAAGNDSEDNDVVGSYPADYPLRNIISVASTDSDDAMSDFSNYGVASVHLAAPGGDILSLQPGGGTQYLSGTSMATPHVTGVAALMKAANPALSGMDIKNGLLNSVEELDTVWDYTITGGILNALGAVNEAMQRAPSPRSAPAEVTSLKIKIAKKKSHYDVTVSARGFQAESEAVGALPGITAKVTCKELKGKKKTFKKNGKTKSSSGSVVLKIATKNKLSCYATSGMVVSSAVKSK